MLVLSVVKWSLNAVTYADSQLIGDSKKSPFSNALRIQVEGDERVDIQLPGNSPL